MVAEDVPDDDEVEAVIAACGGDPRAAVRALIVALAYAEAEVERLAEAVSRGFTRGGAGWPADGSGA